MTTKAMHTPGQVMAIAEHLSDAARIAFWKYEFDLAIAQIRKRDAERTTLAKATTP